MPEAARSPASAASPKAAVKRVVVVIPAYNAERTLPRCLEALGRSTLKPLATIVVDDCSTDGTAAAAARFGCTVARMPRNGGQAKGRNYGVAQAPECDYYCFVDADVLVHPDTIAKLVATVESKPERAAASVVYVPIVAGERLGFFGDYKNLYASHKWGSISGPTTLLNSAAAVVRARVFREVGGFAEHMRAVEDQELATKIAERYEVWLDGVGSAIPQVVHLRPHTFRSLCRDTFNKGVWNVVYFFSRGARSSRQDAKRLHVLSFPFLELLDIFVGPAILAAAVAAPFLGRPGWLALAGLTAFYWLTRAPFIAFIFRRGGLALGLGAMFFMIGESTICLFALFKGAALAASGRTA
jgi:glycosyltransferase involved in cell wall biosynthesis